MKDKSLKILLGIIAVNLTLQTIKDFVFFPTAEAQSRSDMQAAISYCWDLARIERQSDREWQIRTYC